MSVISKEYQILSQKVRSEQAVHVEKLDARNQLLKEIRSMRETNKCKKREIVEVNDRISTEEFQRVKQQGTLNSIKRKIAIEEPVNGIKKMQETLEKQLEIKEKEL